MRSNNLQKIIQTLGLIAIAAAVIMLAPGSIFAQGLSQDNTKIDKEKKEESSKEEKEEAEETGEEKESEKENQQDEEKIEAVGEAKDLLSTTVDGDGEMIINPDDVFLQPDADPNMDGMGPPVPRDLDMLYEEAKDKGSLEEIMRRRERGHMPPPPIVPDPNFMGPMLPHMNPLGNQGTEAFTGPLPPPDINLWDLGAIDDEEDEPYEDEDYIPPPIDFEDAQPPEEKKFVDLSADKITRDKLNNVIFLEGNAKVVYEDVIILSEFAEFNDDEEWGKFWGPGGVLAESDDGLAKCIRLEAYFAEDEKTAYLHENVEIFVYSRDYSDEEPLDDESPRKDRLKRALGQDDTTIHCDEATYDWGKKIFHAWVEDSDLVKIVQDGRYAHAKAVYNDRELDLAILEGDVELWQKDGDWLFERDVVKDKDDKWANALLRPETTITCDVLESDGESEITTLEGNVLAVQKEKRASADKVTQNEADQIMIAEGNVKAHQDNGDWLIDYEIVDPEEESEETIEDVKKPTDFSTDKFTLHTDTEDFIAEGNVKAVQEDQDAAADKVQYTKEIDSLQIFGNVIINTKDEEEKNNQLISDKGILWLTTKVYEAFGNVTSSTKVDLEEERDKLKEEASGEE